MPPETPETAHDHLVETFREEYGPPVSESIAAAPSGFEQEVRADERRKVAEEFAAAAQAIKDSRGEDVDPLTREIWDRCGRTYESPATLDDPRTIATVAYRHLARVLRGERP